ncbi:D-aminoacyl-tRNA deacylase [Myxococcota bacterium]|nr:D-aminoacyl-tRNA deacylase [Myxococcota bacterium]
MRALVQRVSRARVTVAGEVIGAIDAGLLVFLGVTQADTDAEMVWVAEKVANLRIFSDDVGKMNRSVVDVGGGVLVVSQFTLYGDAKKGNRPSFVTAARPEHAEPMYERFVEKMKTLVGGRVATGKFAAEMAVELVNDGPVTLWIEREPAPTS